MQGGSIEVGGSCGTYGPPCCPAPMLDLVIVALGVQIQQELKQDCSGDAGCSWDAIQQEFTQCDLSEWLAKVKLGRQVHQQELRQSDPSE